jgi:hypothetical protein
MATIGKYCKSYPLSRLRQFSGWHEQSENSRKIRRVVEGEIVEVARQLSDDDYVYLHGDFTVTDGIFIDENIIFDEVTPAWKEFCSHLLDGSPPKGKT